MYFSVTSVFVLMHLKFENLILYIFLEGTESQILYTFQHFETQFSAYMEAFFVWLKYEV